MSVPTGIASAHASDLLEPSATPPAAPASPLPDKLDAYKVFRNYLEHEDALINQRITWMLTIHGFLYATYGFTLQKVIEINEKISNFGASNFGDCNKLNGYIENGALYGSFVQTFGFLAVICVVGLGISASALLSIKAALSAIIAVREIFKTHSSEVNHEAFKTYAFWENDKRRFPLLTGGGYPGRNFGFGAAWFIPTLLMAGWLVSGIFLFFEYSAETTLFLSGFKCPLVTDFSWNLKCVAKSLADAEAFGFLAFGILLAVPTAALCVRPDYLATPPQFATSGPSELALFGGMLGSFSALGFLAAFLHARDGYRLHKDRARLIPSILAALVFSAFAAAY